MNVLPEVEVENDIADDSDVIDEVILLEVEVDVMQLLVEVDDEDDHPALILLVELEVELDEY